MVGSTVYIWMNAFHPDLTPIHLINVCYNYCFPFNMDFFPGTTRHCLSHFDLSLTLDVFDLKFACLEKVPVCLPKNAESHSSKSVFKKKLSWESAKPVAGLPGRNHDIFVTAL